MEDTLLHLEEDEIDSDVNSDITSKKIVHMKKKMKDLEEKIGNSKKRCEKNWESSSYMPKTAVWNMT